MTTVFKNANFISLNSEDLIYSVMVVKGKEIVYLGYNTPICYEDEKSVDLGETFVIPLINDTVYYDITHAKCKMLCEGEQADFIALDKNPFKDNDAKIVSVYIKGKKKI